MDILTGSGAQITGLVLAGVIAAILFVLLVATLRKFIKVCPPNRVMIVEGVSTSVGERRYGFRIVRGGYAIVVPYFTRARFLDLSVIPINVRVENCNAANGIVVGADATACVGIDLNDDTMLYIGVEKLMGKTREQIHDQIKDTLVGNFRGAMGRSTPLEAMGMEQSSERRDSGRPVTADSNPVDDKDQDKDRDKDKGDRARFRRDMLADMSEDLGNFGIRVFSVSIMRIWDQSEYISNLATKAVAAKRQDVEIAEAEYSANADNAESDALRRRDIAKNRADEAIAGADESLGVAKGGYSAAVAEAEKTAQAGIESARNRAQVAVEKAEQELQRLRNQTEKTIKGECDKQAAEIRGRGQSEADRIEQGARNAILEELAAIVSEIDGAELPLFVTKQLPLVYDAYGDAAKDLGLDNITLMGDDESDAGINAAVNRGPAALADFLRRFESIYGIHLRDMLGTAAPGRADAETRRVCETAKED